MKRCSYCAEEIHDDAIKCKHCGSDLLSGERVEGTVEESVRPEPRLWQVLAVLIGITVAISIAVKMLGSSPEPKPEVSQTEVVEPPVVEPIEYKDITPEVTNKFKSRGRQLYVRLTKIKVGDHSGIPSQEELRALQAYRKWGRDAAKLEDECDSESSKIPEVERMGTELFRTCAALKHLQYEVGDKIVFDRDPSEIWLTEVKTVFGVAD